MRSLERVNIRTNVHTYVLTYIPGLSHPFLGMGTGPLELGKIASF